ncbi:YqhA family protein [Fulvivirgaceae bacterium PWU4]|uniref:YqhA family protein n=1 Tax=Chryseosolibacter histidini TaxID=2782349 RepID=A0AAP2DRY2_9BACT|nr:YqhA family protein [Chryseosolibacter histidini]MBT1699299.1 YqhA family protein [Chryseosolibacter histidini]
MKGITGLLRTIIAVIAWFVFACGIVLAGIGVYEFMIVFTHLDDGVHHTPSLMIIGLLHAVDLFLIAIVFFVMALGFFILFSDPDAQLPVRLPEWLRIKNFTQLKIILWEAILTTLVVLWLASLVERRIKFDTLDLPSSLYVPAAVLLISISLFLLKKGEH